MRIQYMNNSLCNSVMRTDETKNTAKSDIKQSYKPQK